MWGQLGGEAGDIALLGGDEVYQRLADAAKCAWQGGIQRRAIEARAGFEQAQIGPEIELEQLDKRRSRLHSVLRKVVTMTRAGSSRATVLAPAGRACPA